MRICRLLLVLSLSTFVAGCGPRLDVAVAIEDGKVVFDVPPSGVNGLLGFRVEDPNGTVLWHVDMSYEQGKRIVYGEIPTGGNMVAKQLVPADGSAPPDIRGRTVRVRVEYQYDDFLAPSADDFVKDIQVP